MSEDYTTERFECDVKLEEIRQNFLNPIKNEKLCSYCRCHDHNWTCPPFYENQTDIWNHYENVKLIMMKFNFTENIQNKKFDSDELMEYAFDLHHGAKKIIEPELYALEEELNGHFLTSGPCVNCSHCQRLENKECIMPDKRKYAMESLGANIIGISKKYFNLDMQWIKNNKLPEFIIMMVCVLY